QAMLQEACQILQSTRGYADLWIGLLDEAGQRLRQVAGAGIAADVEPVDVSLDEPGPPLYCARTALNERRPYLVKDVGESHPCATCTYRARATHAGALAVPLLHRQGCYGALVIYTERPWAFHEDETELLSELANDLALGLYSLEAEEKLRQSEERFRNAFERAAIGRGIAAPDGRFLQANQSFCDIVGYPMDEFLQKKWQDITHPADLEASARHVGQLMAGEVPSFRFEHRLVHRDGHAVWVDLNVVLVRDLDGSPLYMVGDIVDLTERKKLEEILSSERDEFNFILQELPVGVTVLDSEDKYVYINPASLKIDGYKNDRDSLVGQDVRGNHPPHTLATVEQLLHDFKAGERSVFSREARRGRRTVEITYHALRDLEGEYQGLVRLVSDITERRQAAEALRASEEKYRLLVETANEAIVVAQDGRLKFFNPKAMEITGYSQAELASKPFPELIHPDDRQMVVENHLKRLAGETLPQTYPFRIVDKSGNTKWMEINAVVIDWEGRPATLNLLTDITERKRAEELLRESEERYRTLFEQANDGIHLANGHDEIIDANPRMCEMMGYSREELLAMRVPDLQAPEVDRPEGGVVRGEVAHYGNAAFEALNVHRDGTRIPIEVSVSRVTGVEGELFVSVVRDITERKRAEAVLKEYSERLEEMVEERTAELAYRAGQLEHLRELDASLLGATSLEATLQLLAEGAVTHLGYNGAAVGLYDPEERSLVVPAIYPLDSRIEKLRALAGVPGPGALRFALSGEGTLFDRVLAGETMLVNSLTRFLDAPLARVVAQGVQNLYRFGCVQFVPLTVEGEVVGVLIGAVRERDLSARKQAGLALLAGHAALAIQQAQLREAEQRRTVQLEAALSELEQAQEQLVRREKLATLGQLAGGVAHELRNPLGAINNAAYYLNLVLEEPQPAVKETLEILDREV
ncbi:MAG: PAS domain S-box protein, partial [Anaerolineae bacterium]